MTMPSDDADAKGWNDKGFALYQSGRYEEAIKCYDKAIEIAPHVAVAHESKKAALEKLGRHEDAS